MNKSENTPGLRRIETARVGKKLGRNEICPHGVKAKRCPPCSETPLQRRWREHQEARGQGRHPEPPKGRAASLLKRALIGDAAAERELAERQRTVSERLAGAMQDANGGTAVVR